MACGPLGTCCLCSPPSWLVVFEGGGRVRGQTGHGGHAEKAELKQAVTTYVKQVASPQAFQTITSISPGNARSSGSCVIFRDVPT